MSKQSYLRGSTSARATAALLATTLVGCQAISDSFSTSKSAPTPTVVTAAGDIGDVIASFRSLLGPDNGGAPGAKPSGRREINWDGVPHDLAAPNFLPADVFNTATAPRARGAHLTTPGSGLQASASAGNPTNTPPRFAHINKSYSSIFKAYSGERLFSPVGSHIVDMTFRVPGTQTRALSRGFGAVYVDVDEPHTAFEYFDKDGKSLGRFSVPAADKGFSFLGVAFEQPIIARVRIEYGTKALGPDDGPGNDVAIMDDFIYGEPQAIP